jgi:ketosteroid isomerase-like protein
MSQETVEIMRTLVAQWNAGDRDLSRSGEYLDPSVHLEGPLSSLTAEPYRGHAGIERWMRDLDEQFDVWEIDIDDVHQVGDRVVVAATIAARGRASGTPLEIGSACVVDFGSDQRVTRVRIYPQVREALRAAGLDE